MSGRWRLGLIGAALVLATTLLAITAKPTVYGSRFAHGNARAPGARALALYMEAEGWDVRATVTIPGAIPPSTGTLIVPPEFASTLTNSEREALYAWVHDGGRAVLLGAAAATDPLSGLFGLGPTDAAPHDIGTLDRFPGVRELAISPRRLEQPLATGWEPWLELDDGIIVAGQRHGAGELFTLADASPLTNALLREADNLPFALHVLGAPGRSVLAFYGRDAATVAEAVATEAQPLPFNWKLAGAGLVLAAVAGFWLLGRRTGPLLPPPGPPPRPLTEYIGAQAHAYRRAEAGGAALGYIAEALRRDLARIGGLPLHASRAALAAVAERHGVSAAETERVLADLETATKPGSRDMQRLAAAADQLQRRLPRVH